ncbi:hypothetical protein BDD12DRAFT_828383 [Trichophaea hybrida]|nr:hypothetical protein BDD12DRAFT_828383 [Trichophaea hybrida]
MQFSILTTTLTLILTLSPFVSAVPSPNSLTTRAVSRSADGSTTCYFNWRQRAINSKTYDRLVGTMYRQANWRGELSDGNGACCGNFCMELRIAHGHTIHRRDVDKQVRKLRKTCIESSRSDEGTTTFKDEGFETSIKFRKIANCAHNDCREPFPFC